MEYSISNLVDAVKWFFELKRYYRKDPVSVNFNTATVCHMTYPGYITSDIRQLSSFPYHAKRMMTEIFGEDRTEWRIVKSDDGFKFVIFTNDDGYWTMVAALSGWKWLIDVAGN